MTNQDVIQLVYSALRQYDVPEINDVTVDHGADCDQVILTTDDGEYKQVWVIDGMDIFETDPPEDTD